MATRTRAQYLESLRDGRTVIYDGARVDVVEHPELGTTARAVAGFYDFQNRAEWRDLMTVDADGERIGTAFCEPRSRDELVQVAASYAAWAEVTSGFMGRSPDYMNTAISALGTASHALAAIAPEHAARSRAIYLDARRRDLCYTHTFAEPFKVVADLEDQAAASCKVVGERSDGLVVRGARGLATLAPFANMNFDLFGGVSYQRAGAPQVLGFVVPVQAQGLRWLCRPSYLTSDGPLSSRWDEMDCVAIFDDCVIPWEQVYVCIPQDVSIPSARFLMAVLQHHVLVRSVAKTRFLLGLGHLIAESSRISKFVNVRDRLGDMVGALRTLEALAVAAIEDAVIDPDTRRVYPNPDTVQVAVTLYSELHSRMIQHIKDLGGSRHTSAPHRATLETLSTALKDHFKGSASSAEHNIALFALAWDVAGSAWGGRQDLYERFHFGDAVLRRAGAYLQYDMTEAVALVERALRKEDRKGDR